MVLGKSSSRSAAARCGVFAPVREHLDPQIEIDRRADERFDLFARGASDVPDALPLGADEDPLLAVALDVDDRSNVHRRCVLTKLLDLARDAVRHFVVELLERRLAHQLARRRSAPSAC